MLLDIDQIPPQFIWQDSHGLTTKDLGTAAASKKLYVSIDILEPGSFSTKYHSHTQQEEFFLVLEGSGTLRLNDQQIAVGKGNFFSKHPGACHSFFNSGSTTLVILDVGTNQLEDICYYPDDDIYVIKTQQNHKAFKGTTMVTHWSTHPNP